MKYLFSRRLEHDICRNEGKISSQDSIQNALISSKLKYVAHLNYNFQSVEDHLTLSLK